MLDRALWWARQLPDLGRLWLLSRQPHVEAELPSELGEGLWVAIATQRPVQPGEPVYGTPAYKPVGSGERYWVFVPEGDYWIYAVQAEETQAALRAFYASPDDAVLVDSAVPSQPGFRMELG